MKYRIILATLFLTAWAHFAHGQATPVQGTVRAPAATLATLLQTPSLDPENGGMLVVVCDQDGTSCQDVRNGVGVVAGPLQWSVTHSPAAATQATASKAAGGGGVQHVAVGMTACIGGAGANATVANATTVNLRDGATGAGTVLWTAYLLNLAATSQCLTVPLNLAGTANTAMTLEFAGAPAASSSQTVTLVGYDVQ